MFSFRLSFYYVRSMPLNPAARCKYWLSCMVNCFHVCFACEHICSRACLFLRESIVPWVKKGVLADLFSVDFCQESWGVTVLGHIFMLSSQLGGWGTSLVK